MYRYAKGDSPLDYLTHAIQCIASAISNKPKDPALHMRLGILLEEKYYAEDVYGLKKEEVL